MVDKLEFLNNLSKVRPTQGGQGVGGAGGAGPADGKDFKQQLLDSISEVNRLQQEAQTATEKLATGQATNVAEVFSAVRKADVAFSLLMQIRNQLVDAYTEIRNMRM